MSKVEEVSIEKSDAEKVAEGEALLAHIINSCNTLAEGVTELQSVFDSLKETLEGVSTEQIE